MRLLQLTPLFLLAPVWAQCDMEIYGYNPATTEITIVVNDGHCLTEADSIGEFLLGMTFDPPLVDSPFPCVQGLDWALLIFPLDFPGFDIGQGNDDILQSGDTITFHINQVPLFGSGTADCWLTAIQDGAWFNECIILGIYQINDSNTLLGGEGLTNEPYPDVDPANNILAFSLGPYCPLPPPPYQRPIWTPDPCNNDDIFIPNAFTPNNDGKNDSFRAITDEECWLWFEMQVFNRWGHMVWETDVPGMQWIGNNTVKPLPYAPYQGEYYCPDGVYYWRLRGQKKGDVWVELNGTVTLLR